MGFCDWLENNYSIEMSRVLMSYYRKLDGLDLLDKPEEEFEDYIWQHITSKNTRKKLRNVYHIYQKWRNNVAECYK